VKRSNFSPLLERFFTHRLMTQRQASPHTIASYRDTFRLLLRFAQQRLHKPPSNLNLSDLDAPFIGAFLDDLEKDRGVTTRTRNVRLTAIRSFFRYAAYEQPAQSGQIQRVLAIPSKRQRRPLVGFLTRPEIDAILSSPDRSTWLGRRDHALLLLALQTGLRLSEITSLGREDVVFGTGSHVRCEGKGRKERCTPLTRQTVAVLKAWLKEPARGDSGVLFPTVHGRRLSPDAVQYLLNKYTATARHKCPTLKHKRVTPHVLRHSVAMELLQGGVDPSVIALWLGHDSVATTQIYLHAHLALKEAALAKIAPLKGKVRRFQADDQLLDFLRNL
jgi:integrase/recombinase XerD